MCFVMEDHIYYFGYLAYFIEGLIDVVNWYGLKKFIYTQVVLLYKVFVDEDFYNTKVN